MPFQAAQPAQTSSAFGNFSQTSGFGGTSNMFGQSTFGQQLYVSTIVNYYLLSLLLTDHPTTYMYALLLFIWKDVYIIIFHSSL